MAKKNENILFFFIDMQFVFTIPAETRDGSVLIRFHEIS